MRTPFIQIATLAFAIGWSSSLSAQQPLDDYIAYGLENNPVLQQKNTTLEKALLSLKIANGLFAPTVALQANYTHGQGGRSINLPVGNLLNPVYEAIGSSERIENQKITFFPQNFYDVKVRTSLPIFNTDLIYNRKISYQQELLQEYEVTIYKRELIKSIKTAYFNYLSAVEAKALYESAMNRALESKRVNESLLANGKGLPAYVIRSQSEIESIQSQLTEAEQQVKNAQLYFNLILNRPETSDIDASLKASDLLDGVPAILAAQSSAESREELLQLQSGVELTSTALKMRQSFSVPKLGGFLDLGAQAENLKYNDDAKYFLVGVQLDVPVFAGLTNRHKIQQAKLDQKNAELNRSYVSRQLAMSSSVSQSALTSAYQHYKSAQKQLEFAQTYSKLIEKGYKEGVNTFIESTDARNLLVQSQLLVTLSQYKVLIAVANLERETASYSFSHQ